MSTKYDFILTDRRILEQKLRKHELAQKEYDKVLKGLDDEQSHGDEMKVFDETAEVVSEE